MALPSPKTIQLGSDNSSYQHTEVALIPSSFPKTNASQSKQRVEEVHAAVVDTPNKVADLWHASPDTWHTLPPSVEVYDRHPPTVPAPNEVEAPDGTSAATYLAALQLR
jgi:hypothetical protein